MNTDKFYTIAVDGPAASGKGTLARRIAKELNFAHLDTGKLYRALAYMLKEEENALQDIEFIVKIISQIELKNLSDPALLFEGIGNLASKLAALPEVRHELLCFQRDFAEGKGKFSYLRKESKGAVLDGRDIGTVVCPKADLKIFLTASLESRAKRRFIELQKKQSDLTFEMVMQDLQRRDERDKKRKASPLVPDKNATILDSTSFNEEKVFEIVLELIKNANIAK